MSFQVKTCVILSCDGCDDPWDDDYPGEPHFESESDAVEYMRGSGWIIAGTQAWCPSCSAKMACARVGHTWLEWSDLELEGVRWRSRHCDHCSESEQDPPNEVLYTLLDAARVLNATPLDGDGDV